MYLLDLQFLFIPVFVHEVILNGTVDYSGIILWRDYTIQFVWYLVVFSVLLFT